MEKQLPVKCPSCGAVLSVQRFACPACQTSVEGSFAMPLVARLTLEEQELALHLIKASGSLKDLAAIYRVFVSHHSQSRR